MQNLSRVWLETGLDIDLALDPTDKDLLYIDPNEAIKTTMQAMESLGFQMMLRKAICAQLRFSPSLVAIKSWNRGLFGIQEVELSFISDPERPYVVLEIDRAFRGYGYTSFTLEHRNLNVSDVSN